MHKEYKEQSAYKIGIFEKTVAVLEEAVLEPADVKRFVIDSCVTRFKLCFEASWKALKVVLLEKYKIDAAYPKVVLMEAYKVKLIDDEDMWITMLDERNEVTHVYDQDVADHIYDYTRSTYFFVLKKTMLMLKEQYGSEFPVKKKK